MAQARSTLIWVTLTLSVVLVAGCNNGENEKASIPDSPPANGIPRDTTVMLNGQPKAVPTVDPAFSGAGGAPTVDTSESQQATNDAELPANAVPSVQINPKITASHCHFTDSIYAINDKVLPAESGDFSIPRLTWWDHRGTDEWVAYEFSQPQVVRSASVYWYDDTRTGECRVPASYRLLWYDGVKYRPVELEQGQAYGVEIDKFNEFSFHPVTTSSLKLEVKLQSDYSGGILEWRVQ